MTTTTLRFGKHEFTFAPKADGQVTVTNSFGQSLTMAAEEARQKWQTLVHEHNFSRA